MRILVIYPYSFFVAKGRYKKKEMLRYMDKQYNFDDMTQQSTMIDKYTGGGVGGGGDCVGIKVVERW